MGPSGRFGKKSLGIRSIDAVSELCRRENCSRFHTSPEEQGGDVPKKVIRALNRAGIVEETRSSRVQFLERTLGTADVTGAGIGLWISCSGVAGGVIGC